MIPLGIINHAPDFIIHKFTEVLHLNDKDVVIVTDKVLPKRVPRLMIFLTVGAFRIHLPALSDDKYLDTIVCVFADPIKLHNFDLIPFDYNMAADVHIDAFTFTKPAMSKLKVKPVTVTTRNLLAEIVEKVQTFNGILTQFMTFIYSLPSATHQKPVKEMVCNWLISSYPESVLDTSIAKLRADVKLTDKQVQRLKDIVTSDIAKTYKKVLQQTANCKDLYTQEFIKIITANKISAYEIRYIRSITDKK